MNVSRVAVPLLVVVCVAVMATAQDRPGDSAYHSPTALVADSSGRNAFVIDKTASQVIEVELRTGKVLRNIALPGRPTGAALDKAARRLYVTAEYPANCIYVIDLQNGKVDSVLAAGHTPMAPVLSADESTLYVSNRFNDDLSIIDLQRKREIKRLPLVRQPVSAALSPDGKLLIVGNQDPEGPATAAYAASAVSLIDTQRNEVIANVLLPNGGVSIRDVTVSPDNRYAFVSHLLAHNNAPTTHLEKGWITTNNITVIDLERKAVLNTVMLDRSGRGAGNPWALACSPDGRKLYITLAGVHELAVLDLAHLLERLRQLKPPPDAAADPRGKFDLVGRPDTDFNFIQPYLQRVPLHGRGPRSIVVRGGQAYVGMYFDGTLESVDLESATPQSQVISLGPQPPENPARKGERLFHDASISVEGWQSCSSCHPADARPDGLNWDLLNDGFGNAKQVKSLLLAHKTPPAMITGIRENAEMAVRSGLRYILFAAPSETVAVAIDEYLKSLKPVPSPYLVNGELSAAAERGKALFDKARCSSCHQPPLYTTLQKAGWEEDPETGQYFQFDIPTLIEVWRTAPYLYNGRAKTIKEVVTKYNPNDRHGSTAKLSEREINDLVEYVLSL